MGSGPELADAGPDSGPGGGQDRGQDADTDLGESRMTLVVGFSVLHRRYVAHSDVHYGDGLISGAYCLRLFGDVATELAIRTDGNESLLAGYSSVELLSPVRAGDVLETSATLRRIGNRSRDLDFEARVVCRASPRRGPSAADVLAPGLVVARALGTIVVPANTLFT